MTQRNVLIVDNDPAIFQELRQSPRGFTDHWTVYFALSAQQALECMAQFPIDVLVTEINLPDIDGVALLEKVSQAYPQVIRFVLSRNSEFTRMLQSTRLAHQFLTKPCDLQQLHNTLSRACRMRELLKDPQLIRLTTGVVKLPSMPTLYMQLLKELKTEEPNPQQIGEIITHDVSMTAKILQLVNSAFFSMPGKVTSPQRAVSILGINTIKALVLGIQVFSEFQQYSSQYFSIDALWNHSLLVGQLTRKIAQEAGLDKRTQEDCQVVGMLHDIGKLLELRINGYFQRVKFENGYVTLESEARALGTTHAQLGAYLLGIWGLPEHIVDVIALHHYPFVILGDFNLATALYIANGLHYLHMIKKPNEYGLALEMDYIERMGITPELNHWSALCKDLILSTPQAKL
jgi:putative nucleotidyltransferase with HDIG domain